MNMHLEYQITFQDDLDCNEVNLEYQFKKTWLKYFCHPIPWLSLSFLYLIWGIIETAEEDKYVLYIASLLSLFCLILWRFLTNPKNAQSYLDRFVMQNKWKQKTSQQENRIITITDKELIFTTDYSELAWKWITFQDFFEAEKGVIIFFVTNHRKYIPKRIFTQETIGSFRDIMNQHVEQKR